MRLLEVTGRKGDLEVASRIITVYHVRDGRLDRVWEHHDPQDVVDAFFTHVGKVSWTREKVRRDSGGFVLLLTGGLHLSKGQLVDIEGRLQTRQWDEDAGRRATSTRHLAVSVPW